MSIDIRKYVDITSGVGGAAAVSQRQLIARFVTKSQYLPLETDKVFEASTTDDVLKKFNNDPNSQEYKRAVAYFSFVNKNIKKPKMISFVKWDTTTFYPSVFNGNSVAKSVVAINDAGDSVNKAGFIIQAAGGGAAVTVRADVSQTTTLALVASAFQTALRTAGSAQQCFATAVVSYNSATQRFTITGSGSNSGDTGLFTITAASTNDVAQLMGFLDGDISATAGRVGDNLVQTMQRTSDISDNYGSFAVIDAMADWRSTATADQGNRPQDLAAWNHALNNKYMFSWPVTGAITNTIDSAGTTWYDKFKGYSGLAVTLTQDMSPNPSLDQTDYQGQSPMEILAATDYESLNGTQSYMYYQFATRAALVKDNTYKDYDAKRVNYIGQTMTAGQKLEFYQDGVLMGGLQAATDMNTYGNEMWLKDAILVNAMNLFMAMPKISANETGRGQLLTSLQDVVTRAKTNGTISVGKLLDVTQQAYITQITGQDKAWYQVQAMGYWLDANIIKVNNPQSGLTRYQFNYTFIYSKDDIVRKVVGSDILI